MIIFGLQTPGVDPCQRVFWINVSICPAIEPNRILIDISPDARIVIAVPVVVQPGLLVVVLSKHKTDTKTQFIDASGLFKKETNNNALLDTHIDQIMAVFDSKANVDHFAQSVPFEKVAANDYNLSVSSYVVAKDNREVVNIAQLNAELKTTVAKIDQLRKDIVAIVAEIEGEELEA